MLDSRRVGGAALLALPAGLVAYFAFNSGGFYPGATAYAAMLLCVVGVIRAVASPDPFSGFGAWLSVGAGALGLLALLTLLSSSWSHAAGVALVEYDFPLAYLLTIVICGSMAHRRERTAWAIRGIALAIVVVCACGLITRVLPHLWPTAPEVANNRLSFPVGYWNVLGLLAVLGVVLCVHFASDVDEPPAIRALGAAAVPVLATTVLFTFSRGAIGVALIALIVYALLGRPRFLVSMAVAVIPPTVVAIKSAYDANLLATLDPTSPAAVAQGHRVAVTVLICAVVAGSLRVGMLALDWRIARLRLPERIQRTIRRAGWTSLAAAAVILVIAFSGTIAHEYHRFLRPQAPGTGTDLRSRLTDPGNDGRIDMWRVAWHQFNSDPGVGSGAGTFYDTWLQRRPNAAFVHDAHSLYLETFDELGVAGVALLVLAILTVLVRVALRARGRSRPLYAALFAVLLAWVVHAGIDWDWEMPVVSIVFFALGGLALARDAGPARPPVPSLTRVQVAIGCLLLGVAPTYVWLSQGPLHRAADAFQVGNCRVATREATSAISTLGAMAQPYQILSFCDVRQGEPVLAIEQIKQAISLDPNNWEYTYSLALMRAAAGLDPRAAAKRALELNPHETLTQDAWKLLRRGSPSTWEAIGRQLTNQFTSL